MFYVTWFCIVWLLAASGPLLSEYRDQMFTDLKMVEGLFQNLYAPKEWKESYNGWDLNREIEEARKALSREQNITAKKYQRILRKFLNSTSDFHVQAKFYSTEFSLLPFEMKSAGGRYFVTEIIKEAFSGKETLAVGDEILSINGRPVAAVLQEFQQQCFPHHNTLTARLMAENYFTWRLASLGQEVQKGKVDVEIIPKSSWFRSAKNVSLHWVYRPDNMREYSPAHALKRTFKEKGFELPLASNQEAHLLMVSPYYEMESETASDEESVKSDLPYLGEVLFEVPENSYFQAYIFEGPRGSPMGFLRIANYMYKTEEQALLVAELLGIILEMMQNNTELLVIDQRDNPGGVVDYMYTLLSMLTDTPLSVPKHRISNTQKDMMFTLKARGALEDVKTIEDARVVLGETFGGSPVTLSTVEQFRAFYEQCIEEWDAGRQLTAPIALHGIEWIEPHSTIRYTRPLVVLIDGLDFSCADFFPAILQDNGRALLFGERTAGAGGILKSMKYPNLLGIESIKYTGSIAVRNNCDPIEGLGVVPDIEYDLLPEDLTDSYSSYVRALKQVLADL